MASIDFVAAIEEACRIAPLEGRLPRLDLRFVQASGFAVPRQPKLSQVKILEEERIMAKTKQLTAWVESKPGELGRIAQALGNAKVNITAFACWSTPGESPIHLQVSSPAKAKKVLQDLGIRITEEEVIRVTAPDRPGVLGEVGIRLAKANINAEYAYATVPKGGKKADIVLAVSDLAGAAKALRGV